MFILFLRDTEPFDLVAGAGNRSCAVSPRRGACLQHWVLNSFGGLSPIPPVIRSWFKWRQCPPGHRTSPKVATLPVGPPAAPISVSFHFYAGHLVAQTIAFRGLLPRSFGPRNLIMSPVARCHGRKIRPSAKVRPLA